jgi:diguanylate cyclase (GGDEF)-like protein
MHDDAVRVLLVEDDEDDFVLTRDLLAEGFGGRATVEWASSRTPGLTRLTEGQFDVALLDYNLGGDTGIDLLREARARGCRTPVIMLTGQNDRATDLNAMHAGASDYLVKGRVTGDLLERAIRYARERHRLLDEISALSLKDDLTGLHNRRAFMTMADQRLQLLERSGSLCLLIFADVDGLKAANDTIGHEAGDRLLVDAARALQTAFRRTDLVARMGGDEFIVLADGATENDVSQVLAKLQGQIDARNSKVEQGAPRLSISTGALPFSAGPTIRLPDLIAEADARMLACKNTRRRSSGTFVAVD